MDTFFFDPRPHEWVAHEAPAVLGGFCRSEPGSHVGFFWPHGPFGCRGLGSNRAGTRAEILVASLAACQTPPQGAEPGAR